MLAKVTIKIVTNQQNVGLFNTSFLLFCAVYVNTKQATKIKNNQTRKVDDND